VRDAEMRTARGSANTWRQEVKKSYFFLPTSGPLDAAVLLSMNTDFDAARSLHWLEKHRLQSSLLTSRAIEESADASRALNTRHEYPQTMARAGRTVDNVYSK